MTLNFCSEEINDKDLEDYFNREVEEISVNETEDGLCLTLELGE